MRPKRFKSMCALVAWMKDEGMTRRVIEVQKGGCEDVSKWNEIKLSQACITFYRRRSHRSTSDFVAFFISLWAHMVLFNHF